MPELLLPHDEPDRIRALFDLGILDTPDEERFDRITRMAARVFDVPIALVSLVDADRQWAKSCVGLPDREMPRGLSFCATAILAGEQLVIEDAAQDPRFADNPIVTAGPEVRFYAGHVLTAASGHRLGTLCIADHRPRAFSQEDRSALADLAGWAEQELSSSELGEALRVRAETEVRLRAVMNTVADAVVSFGDDGVIESVNRAAEETFGVPRGALLGERVDTLLHDVGWDRLEPLLAEGPDSVIGQRREVLGRRADAKTFPLELTVGRTRVGRRTLYVGVGRDVSERKAAERELDRARRQNELVLESAGEGIVGIDRTGRVVFANPVAADTLRRDRDALVGRPLDEVVPRTTLDHRPVRFAGSPVAATLRDGERRRFERRVERSDGTTFPAELVVSALRRDGRAVGAVVVFRDITERYEVDRMKDEFVSVVGHELRTPLTSIRGSLGLLAGGVLGELAPQAERMLDIAVANTDRLVRLINDILDLERIEAGRVDLDRAPQLARELLETTVQVVGATAAERGVRLRVEAGDEAVLGDHDRLVQALTNLAGNAAKFSPEGGEVVLRARSEGDEVRLEVSDHGRGIPAEDLDRIFERFEQVDASDAREKGGTGLGLAIARSIVDQHAGRIWAESPPGAGATFVVALPALADHSHEPRGVLLVGGDADVRERLAPVLAAAGRPLLAEGDDAPAAAVLVAGDPAEAPDALEALAAVPATAGTPIVFVGTQTDAQLVAALEHAVPAREPRRVLVVEDDHDLARVLARTLERRGARVELARTGRQALEALEREAPDLVLLDLVLPDGDGFGVADRLRADDALAGVPLVVYTAVDLDAGERARLQHGDTQILTKGHATPADVEAHVARLLEVLG